MTTSQMAMEAAESGAAVARLLSGRERIEALGARLRVLAPRFVVVCGRGSSGHAGTYLRYVLARRLGLVAADAMPSLASIYGRAQDMRGALFLAISQSGRSPDLVAQTRAARQGGAFCLGLVNDPDSPLAGACDAVLDVAAGPERSVAATKTVIASVAAGIAVAAAWAADAALWASLQRLPARLDLAAGIGWPQAVALLAGVDQAFTVGRGPGLAVAAEAALKLAEVAGIAGLAYSAAELSHGPVTLAGPDFPVLGFVQEDAARAATTATLAELAARGVPVLAAGAEIEGATKLAALPAEEPDLDLLPQLLCFYRAVEEAARMRGRDPDRPPALSKVTKTT